MDHGCSPRSCSGAPMGRCNVKTRRKQPAASSRPAGRAGPGRVFRKTAGGYPARQNRPETPSKWTTTVALAPGAHRTRQHRELAIRLPIGFCTRGVRMFAAEQPSGSRFGQCMLTVLVFCSSHGAWQRKHTSQTDQGSITLRVTARKHALEFKLAACSVKGKLV